MQAVELLCLQNTNPLVLERTSAVNIAFASQAPSRVRQAAKKPSKAPAAPVAPHAKKENKNLGGPALLGGRA